MTKTLVTRIINGAPTPVYSFSTSKDLYDHLVNQLPYNTPDPTPMEFPQYATDVPGVTTTHDVNADVPAGGKPAWGCWYLLSANQIYTLDPRVGNEKVELPSYWSISDIKTRFSPEAQRFLIDGRIAYLRSTGVDIETQIKNFYAAMPVDAAYDAMLNYLFGSGLWLILLGVGLIITGILVWILHPLGGGYLITKGLLLLAGCAIAAGIITAMMDPLMSLLYGRPAEVVPGTGPGVNCTIIIGADQATYHGSQASESGAATWDKVSEPATPLLTQMAYAAAIIGGVVIAGIIVYAVVKRKVPEAVPGIEKVIEVPKKVIGVAKKGVRKIITVGKDIFGRPVQKEVEVPEGGELPAGAYGV